MWKTIQPFLDKQGLLKSWPAKRQSKEAVLHWLSLWFVTGRFYTEKEVNAIIEEHHSFGDYFLLRRELINHGLMERTANGARYWRGRLWPQLAPFETERLSVKAAESSDFPALWAACSACGSDELWLEPAGFTEGNLLEMLEDRDLPPNGSPEFHHMLLLTDKATGQPAGLVDYYTAYPRENANWIGLFLLHPDSRRRGLGREFLTAYRQECALQGVTQIGIGVLLRNQPALKFWFEQGFRELSSVAIDDEKGLGVPGRMGLFQRLPSMWEPNT